MDHDLGLPSYQNAPQDNPVSTGGLHTGNTQQQTSSEMLLPPAVNPTLQAATAQQPVPSIAIDATQSQGTIAHGQKSDDESDSVLDEEWIEKARTIVEKTRNDPYIQSREINRIRAQFMKAQYNRTIKTVEDQK